MDRSNRVDIKDKDLMWEEVRTEHIVQDVD